MYIRRVVYIAGSIIVFLIVLAGGILFAYFPNIFTSFFSIALLAIFGVYFAASLLGSAFFESYLKESAINENGFCSEKDSTGQQHPVSHNISNIAENTEKENAQNNFNKEWCSAMYERFGNRWHSYFDSITYPADKASRAELVAMSWEIASITMDYVLTENEDPALLRTNKEMTKVIANRDSFDKLDLKEFYNDPSTVPAKVIVVYDVLSQMVASKQSLDVVAFGHILHVNK